MRYAQRLRSWADGSCPLRAPPLGWRCHSRTQGMTKALTCKFGLTTTSMNLAQGRILLLGPQPEAADGPLGKERDALKEAAAAEDRAPRTSGERAPATRQHIPCPPIPANRRGCPAALPWRRSRRPDVDGVLWGFPGRSWAALTHPAGAGRPWAALGGERP